MADIFIYNGESFLPDYLPGLIGYGQRGANGNIGATGSSVHYSSLNVLVSSDTSSDSSVDESALTPNTEYINKKVIDLILLGKELSNNGYSSRDVEYMVNDIFGCIHFLLSDFKNVVLQYTLKPAKVFVIIE